MDFFRKVIALEKKLTEEKVKIYNGIETNGTLITDEWADFFKKNNFFIGISIDGPKFINDIHRRSKKGKSSFNKTLKGIKILEDKKIPFSILSVITNKNFKYYKEMLNFYLNFNNLRYIDFLPGYDPNGKIEYLGPKNYATFLVSCFDEWIKLGGSSRIHIRFFEDIILKISNKITKNTPIG